MLDTKQRVRPVDRTTPAQDNTPLEVRITKLESLVRRLEGQLSRMEQDHAELREQVENLP